MRKDLHDVLCKKGALGAFIQLPSPEVVEIFGDSGYEFLIIDNEHTMNGWSNTQDLVRAAEAVDTCAIIRTVDEGTSHIKKALDTGAAGILVPGCNSAATARQIVYDAKYAPMGLRGSCPGVRANYYGKGGLEYYQEANEKTMVLVQIEGAKGVEEIDEILDTKGLDGILLGPVDLSMAIGVPGDVNDPRVIQAMIDITKKANKKGVLCGTFAMDLENAKKWLDLGMDFIGYHIDTMLIRSAVANAVAEYRTIVK